MTQSSIPALALAAPLLGCAAHAGRAPEARAVTEVIQRFSDATVAHDFDAMTGLFSPRAVWEATGQDLAFRLEGTDAIRAAFVRSDATVDVIFQQIGAPFVFEATPDRARARTSVLELLRLRATGEVKEIFGTYVDELVPTEHGWRFAHRRFVVRHSVNLGAGEAPSHGR